MYCVYLTIYSGNLLPPFYIGSTSVKKIENGYSGSVSSKKYNHIWKKELRENSHLFKTKIISTYKTKKESLKTEERLQRKLNVIKSPMYINLSFANDKHSCSEIGKFTTESSSGKNNAMYGYKWTKEQRNQILETKKKNGKTWKYTEESSKRRSEQQIGSKNHRWGVEVSEETRTKMSAANKNNSMKMLEEGKHPSQISWTCEHCNKTGFNPSNYSRWHGNNCKQKGS